MFSVIIPVYNKSPHLKRSIGSVLNQSFKDFELILVDDNSTDGSWEWLQALEDPMVKIYRRESPGPGGYAARNFGVKKASKEWIAFLDADDEWVLDRLEKMRGLIEDFPEANFLSSGWREYFDSKRERLDFYYQNNHTKGPHYLDIHTFLKEKQPIWTSVAVIRKSLFEKTGGFNEHFRKGGDIELWFRVFLQGQKGAWLNELTATYFNDAVNMVTKTEKSIEIPVFETVGFEIKKKENRRIKKSLVNYKNKLVYLKSKNLILLNQPFRSFFWREFDFFNMLNKKVYVASIFLVFAPRNISKKLIKMYIL